MLSSFSSWPSWTRSLHTKYALWHLTYETCLTCFMFLVVWSLFISANLSVRVHRMSAIGGILWKPFFQKREPGSDSRGIGQLDSDFHLLGKVEWVAGTTKWRLWSWSVWSSDGVVWFMQLEPGGTNYQQCMVSLSVTRASFAVDFTVYNITRGTS